MQTTPKRLVRGWLPPTPPPIDESRSRPARSAVNQAKTHLEQEAELAIMHAITMHDVPFGEKGATPAEKGAIQRAEGHRSTAGVDGTLPGLHGT